MFVFSLLKFSFLFPDTPDTIFLLLVQLGGQIFGCDCVFDVSRAVHREQEAVAGSSVESLFGYPGGHLVPGLPSSSQRLSSTQPGQDTDPCSERIAGAVPWPGSPFAYWDESTGCREVTSCVEGAGTCPWELCRPAAALLSLMTTGWNIRRGFWVCPAASPDQTCSPGS